MKLQTGRGVSNNQQHGHSRFPVHVHVSKVKVLQGSYKCHFHTARQKRSHVGNGLLFSPEKQGLQIPNMLWRLESNSVEFRAPYGDKVLTSPPIRGSFSLPGVPVLVLRPKQRLGSRESQQCVVK